MLSTIDEMVCQNNAGLISKDIVNTILNSHAEQGEHCNDSDDEDVFSYLEALFNFKYLLFTLKYILNKNTQILDPLVFCSRLKRTYCRKKLQI